MDIEQAVDELFGLTKARQAAFQQFVSMGIPPELVTELMSAEERRILDDVSSRKKSGVFKNRSMK